MSATTTVQCDELNIHLLKNTNFKTVTIEVKMQTLLDRKTVTELTLLPGILRAGTEKYPNMQAMQDELDDLYGASLVIYPSAAGNSHVLNVQMEFANGRFIGSEENLDENVCRFLNELLFRPRIENGAFAAEVTGREIAKLRKSLEAARDDRAGYANERLLDEMAPGERASIHTGGYLEDLDAITPESLYAAYETFVRTARIDVYAAGDIDFDRTADLIRRTLTGIPETNGPRLEAGLALPVQAVEAGAPKTVIETEAIQQAKLHIGCRTGILFSDPDYEAMMVGSVLLGGYPGSLLFSTVREQHSLAYYIGADLDIYGDKMIIFCGIAPADYHKTATLIDEQLTALKNGDFSDEKLEETKAMLIGSYQSSLDSIGGLIAADYQEVLTRAGKTPQQMVETFKTVTREQIQRAARHLAIDTTFLLTAKEGD